MQIVYRINFVLGEIWLNSLRVFVHSLSFGCTEKPSVIIIIRPSNKYDVRPGDKVRCIVKGNHSSVDNYTWIDSATGDVVHHGAEWTIKPCIHTDDDHRELMNDCVNYTDGLLMLECHVTVGMTTARAAVALRLESINS